MYSLYSVADFGSSRLGILKMPSATARAKSTPAGCIVPRNGSQYSLKTPTAVRPFCPKFLSLCPNDNKQLIFANRKRHISSAITAVTGWNKIGWQIVARHVIEMIYRKSRGVIFWLTPEKRLVAPMAFLSALTDFFIKNDSVFENATIPKCQWMGWITDTFISSSHAGNVNRLVTYSQ